MSIKLMNSASIKSRIVQLYALRTVLVDKDLLSEIEKQRPMQTTSAHRITDLLYDAICGCSDHLYNAFLLAYDAQAFYHAIARVNFLVQTFSNYAFNFEKSLNQPQISSSGTLSRSPDNDKFMIYFAMGG